jgi:hypothetical protein
LLNERNSLWKSSAWHHFSTGEDDGEMETAALAEVAVDRKSSAQCFDDPPYFHMLVASHWSKG